MEITGKTKLTGLIGTPVAHSVSPQMHTMYIWLLIWRTQILVLPYTDFRQSVQKVLM